MQVLFNLGYAYHAAKNYQEALNTYELIVKKKIFSTGGIMCIIAMIWENSPNSFFRPSTCEHGQHLC